jgi:hypothetical protein
MPAPTIYQHTPALACEVDMRTLAGDDPFERGGVNVRLSASAGLYWDLLAFLHGYGSRDGDDLASAINTAWSAAGGAGVFSVGIDADDLFYIENNVADFLVKSQGDLYGTLPTGLVGGIKPFRHTATTAWQRGCILPSSGSTKLILGQAGLSAEVTVVDSGGYGVQSLPTWIRVRGSESDADDVWDGLTLEDAEGSSAGDPTWLVGPDGRVVCTYDSGDSDIDWLSDAAMRELGFDGSEVAASSNGRKYVTATHHAPSFLAPSRPLSECTPIVEDGAEVQRMLDGTHAVSLIGPWTSYRVGMRVDGLVGSTQKLDPHLRRFLAACRPGRWVTLYPQWGDTAAPTRGSIDPRRHRDEWDVLSYSSTVPGYSNAYTMEHHARVASYRCGGRLLLQRAKGDSADRTLDYGGREMAQYRDLVMTLAVDVGR